MEDFLCFIVREAISREIVGAEKNGQVVDLRFPLRIALLLQYSQPFQFQEEGPLNIVDANLTV
jgi:hypothetical protein